LDGGIRCLSGVPPLDTDFVQVTAKSNHACGLHANGSAECWPLSERGGEYGVQPPDTAYVSLGSGTDHACGVRREDGGLDCWGRNDYSQASPPDGSFTAVDGGDLLTCAVATEGGIKCWGFEPWKPAGSNFVAVSLASGASCGLQRNGRIRCSYELLE
jgi:hypothetical protein